VSLHCIVLYPTSFLSPGLIPFYSKWHFCIPFYHTCLEFLLPFSVNFFYYLDLSILFINMQSWVLDFCFLIQQHNLSIILIFKYMMRSILNTGKYSGFFCCYFLSILYRKPKKKRNLLYNTLFTADKKSKKNLSFQPLQKMKF
jgi:hypothetical protein